MPRASILPSNLDGKTPKIRPTQLPGEVCQSHDSVALGEAAWRLRCALAGGDLKSIEAQGQVAEQGIAVLIRARLDCLTKGAQGIAAEHLSRLHGLLAELIEVFGEQGWRAASRASQCWRRHAPEIDELVQTLSELLPDLSAAQQTISNCRDDLAAHLDQLHAAVACLHELLPMLAGEQACRVERRLHDLLSAYALGQELAALLAADHAALFSLLSRLHQGVLLQLPGTQLCLAESLPQLNPTRQRRCLRALSMLIESMEHQT